MGTITWTVYNHHQNNNNFDELKTIITCIMICQLNTTENLAENYDW